MRLTRRIRRIAARRSVAAPTAMEIMTTQSSAETASNVTAWRATPPDILIQPYCPQISTLDFHRAEAAIAAGSFSRRKENGRIIAICANRTLSTFFDYFSKI